MTGRAEWNRAYREALHGVWAHWSPALQEQVAAHHRGWAPGRFDFHRYLAASSTRFYQAWRAVGGVERLCDVGGFWGVFPLTLRLLGARPAMTEASGFYGTAFAPLFDHLRARGVEVIDCDPFHPGRSLPRRFDAVTALAVIEHYPHSLRPFMENVVAGIRPGGALYLEVPNIAYWPRRMELLRGRSPLPPVADVFQSEVPFIGHHREYTRGELREVARLAGLRVERELAFNYSPRGGARRWLRPVRAAAFALFPATRECLAVVCRTGAG